MNYKLNNEELVLDFVGRIDSTNAKDVEKEALEVIGNSSFKNLILNFDALEYISSAGLRVVLMLRKSNPSLQIINTSNDVYEILEMTGFTEMIDVKKGYRKLSVDGCEIIGQGANGTVYRLDLDTIIKVYKNPDSLNDIKNERELARKALIKGIPTAIPYDVVKVEDKYGSVFELLNAKSYAQLINEDPNNLDTYIKEFVDLLKIIHSTPIEKGEMPSIKEKYIDYANFLKEYLPEEQANKLFRLINNVPEWLYVNHGDYHIKNVLKQNGEALLIDMDTLCYGHPVFELGSMYNACLGYSELDHNNVESFLGVKYEVSKEIWNKSLALYLNTSDSKKLEEVGNKAKLIGYIRIMRRFIRRNALECEEGRSNVEFYKNEIISLLDKIDDLAF